uniref:Uncharacterized protein n=1 Tax=Strongyloides stercoralis TaxID=6248 RepID=A0A0K0DS52_STRER
MEPRETQQQEETTNTNAPPSISLDDIRKSTDIQRLLVCYLAFRFKNKPRDWKCVIRDWEIRDMNPENAADKEY